MDRRVAVWAEAMSEMWVRVRLGVGGGAASPVFGHGEDGVCAVPRVGAVSNNSRFLSLCSPACAVRFSRLAIVLSTLRVYDRNNHEGGFVRLALVPLEHRDNPGMCSGYVWGVGLVRERVAGRHVDGGREVCRELLPHDWGFLPNGS